MKPSSYRAPAWLPGGNAQTLWPFVCRQRVVCYRRERWTTPDSDFIDLDWLDTDKPEAPLVVLFHGLEGSSQSHSSLSLMHAVRTRGWRGVVVHWRGCSGEANLLPRTYHSGDSAEADWVLRRFRDLLPHAAILAVGVSLGGNVLVKWLAEQGAQAGRVVKAAAAVSTPFDLAAANESLSFGFNQFYARHFLQTLIPAALRKIERFPGAADSERLRAARTLGEFDDEFTAPVHGFRNAAEYYAQCSTRQRLVGIAVPTLLLNACNDPFLPKQYLPSDADVSLTVVLDQPARGGHVGFVSGPFPGRLTWMSSRVLGFFADALGI